MVPDSFSKGLVICELGLLAMMTLYNTGTQKRQLVDLLIKERLDLCMIIDKYVLSNAAVFIVHLVLTIRLYC